MSTQRAFLETSANDWHLLRKMPAAKSMIFELLGKKDLGFREHKLLEGALITFHENFRKLGSAIDEHDAEGYSFVTRAAQSNNEFGIWLLGKLGVDLTKPDAQGRTAEQIARKAGDKAIMKLLPEQREPVETPYLTMAPTNV